MSIDIIILDEFLNNIRQELQKNQTLSHLTIEKLLSIRIPKNHTENSFNIDVEQNLLDIFVEILIKNPGYCLNQSIVDRLEIALLSKKINKNILDAYKEVIKRTQCQTNNFSRVLDVFIDILDENGSYFKYHFDILVCLALASEATTISTLEPFEINLFSDEDIIRSWSFRGLRAAYERKYQSLEFQEWCDNIIDKLVENTKSEVHFNLDLFETITSVKYIDFEKIRDKPQDQWNRELLIFDLIERFKISEGERFHFYKTWLEIEELEEFQNDKSKKIVKTDRLKLALNIDNLLGKNWNFEQLNEIFKILSQYKISPTPENQEKVLLALNKPPEKWLREVNRLTVESNFSKIREIRSAAGLIEELGNINSNDEDLKNFMRIHLLEIIEKIKSSDLISRVLDNTIKDQSIYITQWTEEQIRQWAHIVKENVDYWTKVNDFTIEALAVMKQANFLHTKFHLTDAQILSCLIALNANVDKGRLLQIGTGEGKSTIISVLAVIHALKGKKVDIITSSPVLAERDAKEKEKFYNMFNLQCSDNNDKSLYLAGPKKCYRKEIVYGEATQFQFDTLRTEYA
ncbi:unnamed protein product, partial [Rotaria sordida]